MTKKKSLRRRPQRSSHNGLIRQLIPKMTGMIATMRSLMTTHSVLTLILTALCAAGPVWLHSEALARSSENSHSSGSHSSGHHSSQGHLHTKADPSVHRERQSHTKRSAAAKDHFKKSHPCPSTGRSRGACPGYVIDHIVPLKRGGKDGPSNMQWQTTAEAKMKDRIE